MMDPIDITTFDPLENIALGGYELFQETPIPSSLFPVSPYSPSFSHPSDSTFDECTLSASPPFMEENELRSCLEAWESNFLSSPSSLSTVSVFPSPVETSSSFHHRLPPATPIPDPSIVTDTLFSTPPSNSRLETVVSFDHASSSSSSGRTPPESPLFAKIFRKRDAVEVEERDVDGPSTKRLKLGDSPVELFTVTPQPAIASSITATVCLPRNTPFRAFCRCEKFRDKPPSKQARHWKTACPSNPKRQDNRIVCAVEGCFVDFSRPDLMKRHVESQH